MSPRPKRPRASGRTAAVKSPRPGADNSAGDLLGGVELTELKRLIRLVQRTGIGELELSSGGRTIRISAQAGSMVSVAHAPAPATAAHPMSEVAAGAAGANAPAVPAKNERHIAITSPMVGTFYRAPAPDADPY